MVARKTQFESNKPTKVRAPRARKLKVDMSALPDAVVDGKLVVEVGGKIYFERTLNKVTKVHEGIIKDVSDKGIVQVWDETIEQFYGFSLNQPLPVIKKG